MIFTLLDFNFKMIQYFITLYIYLELKFCTWKNIYSEITLVSGNLRIKFSSILFAGEFSRAVKICTGSSLNKHLIDTVFAIFDEDGDGLLSYKEFIAIMKDRLHRGFKVRLYQFNNFTNNLLYSSHLVKCEIRGMGGI